MLIFTANAGAVLLKDSLSLYLSSSNVGSLRLTMHKGTCRLSAPRLGTTFVVCFWKFSSSRESEV